MEQSNSKSFQRESGRVELVIVCQFFMVLFGEDQFWETTFDWKHMNRIEPL